MIGEGWHHSQAQPIFRRTRMTDNLKIRQPQDPTKINVHEDWELKYWSNKFGATPEQLKQAVKAAGVNAKAVEKHLGK